MRTSVRVFAANLIGLACCTAHAGEFEWSFSGNLSPSLQLGGTASMNYFNAASSANTTFGVTGGSIPNPMGGVASYAYFAGNSIAGGLGGFTIGYTGVSANGGGSYVNSYTMIWDVYIPAMGWTALMNTSPTHGNDADFYVASDGSVGIGALGYSAASAVSAGQWTRIAFVKDQTANQSLFFVNGTQVFSGGAGSLDGRLSLYTGNDAPPQLVILGEGDGSGNYANDLYLSAFYFSDSALSGSTIAGLGGVQAGGIMVVPEPSSFALAGLALCGFLLHRPRNRK
jgi:hypothetical protein